MKKIVPLLLLLPVVAGLIIWAPWKQPVGSGDELKTIRFGMLPYGDHTQAIIGIEKGWFKEVGLDVKHEVIKIENVVPFLKNGTLDICSSPAGLLYPAFESAPGLNVFVFADIFQGYAIMAQPELNCKSLNEFIEEGMSQDEAFKAAVGQMKGRVFAYPSETAIKPFIDLVLEKGGVSRDEITSLVQDDALTINAMRGDRAHFQVGGAPSRIVLEREGYKAIVTSLDVAKTAEPSHLSDELGSVFPDGWATTKKMYEEDRPTLLRLASVNFRINDLIVNNQEAALKIHMPFLTKVTGENFTMESGKIIYERLDPFYTYSQQHSWFNDESDPFFYRHINGAGLQSFIEQGIYENDPPDIEEFIYADDIYRELEELKRKSKKLIENIESENLATSSKLKQLLLDAKHHFSIYNYYDANRIAVEIAQ